MNVPVAIEVPPRAVRAEPWYRSPIVWLVAAIVAVVLTACIATILLAIEHADTPLDIEGQRMLGVPAAHVRDMGMQAGHTGGPAAGAIPQ